MTKSKSVILLRPPTGPRSISNCVVGRRLGNHEPSIQLSSSDAGGSVDEGCGGHPRSGFCENRVPSAVAVVQRVLATVLTSNLCPSSQVREILGCVDVHSHELVIRRLASGFDGGSCGSHTNHHTASIFAANLNSVTDKMCPRVTLVWQSIKHALDPLNEFTVPRVGRFIAWVGRE